MMSSVKSFHKRYVKGHISALYKRLEKESIELSLHRINLVFTFKLVSLFRQPPCLLHFLE